MLSRRHLASLAGAAVLALTGTAWAVAGDNDTAALGEASTTDQPTRPVDSVQPAIRDNFRLFRDRPASGMPAEVAAQVGSSTRYGRNPDLARAIKTVTGTGYVIPGDGYLCIAVPDPVDGYGTGCLPTGAAVRQGLSVTLYGNLGGRAADTVLVPDSGTATDAGGKQVATDEGVASSYSDRPGDLKVSDE